MRAEDRFYSARLTLHRKQYQLGADFSSPLNPCVRAAGIILAYLLGVFLLAALAAPKTAPRPAAKPVPWSATSVPPFTAPWLGVMPVSVSI